MEIEAMIQRNLASLATCALWVAGALYSLVGIGGGLTPLQLRTECVVVLYVLFLFELAITYVQMLLEGSHKGMTRKAILSMVLIVICAALNALCLFYILVYSIVWLLWVIVVLIALEKFNLEKLKNNTGEYIISYEASEIILNI